MLCTISAWFTPPFFVRNILLMGNCHFRFLKHEPYTVPFLAVMSAKEALRVGNSTSGDHRTRANGLAARNVHNVQHFCIYLGTE